MHIVNELECWCCENLYLFLHFMEINFVWNNVQGISTINYMLAKSFVQKVIQILKKGKWIVQKFVTPS
jgi:hypothetical protein